MAENEVLKETLEQLSVDRRRTIMRNTENKNAHWLTAYQSEQEHIFLAAQEFRDN